MTRPVLSITIENLRSCYLSFIVVIRWNHQSNFVSLSTNKFRTDRLRRSMAHEITSRVIENRPFFKTNRCSRKQDAECLISGRRFAAKCFLLDTSWWEQALADRRGVNESTSVKARGSRVRRVSSPDSRKAFPRIVEGPNVGKGKSGTQRQREKENEREEKRAKETMDFYARAWEWNRFARDSLLRSTLFRRSNRQWESSPFS